MIDENSDNAGCISTFLVFGILIGLIGLSLTSIKLTLNSFNIFV